MCLNSELWILCEWVQGATTVMLAWLSDAPLTWPSRRFMRLSAFVLCAAGRWPPLLVRGHLLLLHCLLTAYSLLIQYSLLTRLMHCLFTGYLVALCPSTAYALLIRCIFSLKMVFDNRVHNTLSSEFGGLSRIRKPLRFVVVRACEREGAGVWCVFFAMDSPFAFVSLVVSPRLSRYRESCVSPNQSISNTRNWNWVCPFIIC